jgi:hypothetical protein
MNLSDLTAIVKMAFSQLGDDLPQFIYIVERNGGFGLEWNPNGHTVYRRIKNPKK